jgi:hypothetical protein
MLPTAGSESTVTHGTRRTGAAILALHALTFLALAWWSWRKWPDPLIDFGRELYVPWQITRGKVLHRDLATLFGPLSPYVNALWMRLFGVSLLTLAVCNLAIFAALVAAVHRLVRLATDRFTATAASLLVLVVCGFSQLLPVGNYNFVTPYSHEATHGLALSVLVLLLVQEAATARRRTVAGAAGLAFGLATLTKPEIAIALAAAVAIGHLGVAAVDGWAAARSLAAAFAGAAFAGPALFFLYFRSHMGAPVAMHAVAGGWAAASNPAVIGNGFYRLVMGLDRPGANALWMVLMAIAALAFVGLVIILSSLRSGLSRGAPSRSDDDRPRLPKWALGVVALLASVAPALLPLGRALPLAALAALVAAGMMSWKCRHDRGPAFRWLALATWSAFALAMLGKIFLKAGVAHYGFYLALPALSIVAILLCWVIPNLLDSWRPRVVAPRFRRAAAVTLAAAALPGLALSDRSYRTKTLPIGSGADRFYVSSSPALREGTLAQGALDALAQIARDGDTVAVLPEGVMLNYLSRRDSPLRVVNVMPPELLTFGEDAVLGPLKADPPDFVIFVHRDTGEYGYPLFGTDPRYGRYTMDWVTTRYRQIRSLGQNPTAPTGFGIAIFARID